MRFMVIVKGDKDSEAGVMPDETLLIAMGKFNEELINAGMMLAGDGLHPTSKGVRISFGKVNPTVTDGPFTQSQEIIAGYWIIEAKSQEEMVEWFSRAPFGDGGQIEIRPLFEAADFAPEIKTDEGRAVMQAERAFREGATKS